VIRESPRAFPLRNSSSSFPNKLGRTLAMPRTSVDFCTAPVFQNVLPNALLREVLG
jgi:hypothetical protein